VRNFIYLANVVNTIIKAGSHDNKGLNICNIGKGIPIRIIYFLHIAEEIFEKKAEIKVVGANPGELSAMVANNSKAIRELGLNMNFDLRAGLLSIKHSLEKE